MGLVGREICYTEGLILYLAQSSGRQTGFAARITRTLYRLKLDAEYPMKNQHSAGRHSSIRLSLGFLLVVCLIAGPVLAFAYMNWPRDLYKNADYGKFVGVGAISPDRAGHVQSVLEANGIPNIIEGSVVYGISVPPGDATKAATIVRQDAKTTGCRFWEAEK